MNNNPTATSTIARTTRIPAASNRRRDVDRGSGRGIRGVGEERRALARSAEVSLPGLAGPENGIQGAGNAVDPLGRGRAARRRASQGRLQRGGQRAHIAVGVGLRRPAKGTELRWVSHRVVDGREVEAPVDAAHLVKGGERSCETGGVGEELLELEGLRRVDSILRGGPTRPFRDRIRPTRHDFDGEHPSQMRMGGLGRRADAGHELVASLHAAFRAQ